GRGVATDSLSMNEGTVLKEMLQAAPSPSARKARGISVVTKSGSNEKSEEEGGEPEAIRMRENFNALAVFAPSVPTDAQGRAEVRVKVPDNLTRYRVMAVSVAGGRQFGSGETVITAVPAPTG